MRPAFLCAGGVLLLAGASLMAQTPPYEAAIAVHEVDARSGPSAQFYATSKLRLGEKVRVVQEEAGGWLAIEPPTGSFSWINARLIELDGTGRTAMVLAPEAPVRPGSTLTDQEPNVERVKLPRGSQVLIRQDKGPPKITADGSKWYPIDPQREFRYIPKTALNATPAVENLTAQANRPPAGNSDALWQQAEAARLAGNFPEASRLYEQCARQPGVEPELLNRCLSRLDYLRGAGAPAPYQPNTATANNVGYPPPNYPPTQPVQPGSQSQAVGYGPRPAAPPTPPGQTTAPGRLRRAGFFVDGKQAYVLEDSQGRPVLYVTAQPGVNLEVHLNRIVILAGPIVYRGDLRTNYVVATGVTPMQ
ncbi:MAG: hypothetical protein JNM56_10350 [Planctomycetia bacterium]|nr:hypothetical protein [Planctomycetia bacterium]